MSYKEKEDDLLKLYTAYTRESDDVKRAVLREQWMLQYIAKKEGLDNSLGAKMLRTATGKADAKIAKSDASPKVLARQFWSRLIEKATEDYAEGFTAKQQAKVSKFIEDYRKRLLKLV